MEYPTLADAILNLEPSAEFSLIENDYDGIDWINQSVQKPSKELVDQEYLRLVNLYNSLEYQRQRKEEYPAIEDQLDEIFHNGIDGWKQTIQAVKDKYPK